MDNETAGKYTSHLERVNNKPISMYGFKAWVNLVPRALFPGFGGGQSPQKPGKSALGTRLGLGGRIKQKKMYY